MHKRHDLFEKGDIVDVVFSNMPHAKREKARVLSVERGACLVHMIDKKKDVKVSMRNMHPISTTTPELPKHVAPPAEKRVVRISPKLAPVPAPKPRPALRTEAQVTKPQEEAHEVTRGVQEDIDQWLSLGTGLIGQLDESIEEMVGEHSGLEETIAMLTQEAEELSQRIKRARAQRKHLAGLEAAIRTGES